MSSERSRGSKTKDIICRLNFKEKELALIQRPSYGLFQTKMSLFDCATSSNATLAHKSRKRQRSESREDEDVIQEIDSDELGDGSRENKRRRTSGPVGLFAAFGNAWTTVYSYFFPKKKSNMAKRSDLNTDYDEIR